MKCPSCNSRSKVIYKRNHNDSVCNRRRRCLNCGMLFSSYELSDTHYEDLKELERALRKVKVVLEEHI